MRLPQSFIRSLSVRTIHFLTIGSLILLLGMASVSASAASKQLACAPTYLRFGGTVVGQTETLLLTLTNNGQTSVTISGVSVNNSEFTTSSLSLPLALPAGQSVGLSVSFSPTAIGWTEGTVDISSNASNAALQFEVRGTGVSSEAVAASPSIVSFGQVPPGTVSTVPVVLTNIRSRSVTLSALQTTGTGFSMSGPSFPLTLGAGQSVTLSVAFSPQSAGTVGGSLFISNTGAALVIPLTGTGATAGQLTANPASLAFGSVQAGASMTLTDSLTNTGRTSVTISQATVTGTGFSISGLNLPLVLNPGASVTFSAVFAPQSAVNATGGITVASNASNSLTVSLSGTGTAQGQLTLAPTALNFGSATVGTNVSQTSSLSAGGASVTVASASLSSAEFSLTGVSFPVTIAAGQSTPVTVTFSPQSSGSATATLSVASNASNAPAQTLSGVGVAPTQHSVSLSWTDTNSGIAGYNIYRGSVSGGPYTQINSALDTTPTYSDTSVVSGQTYYYVATAVDGSGVESTHSNEAEGVIPTP
jgi:hypothetical protein